jgi:nitroimidazol reductase NimA-like FMN-containing flavoprotein (pyridoxamine 5'-phosphate oxidase superfamily)
MSPGAAQDHTEPAQVIPLADLLERPLYAHLATVRPDGTPQVNPTWFRFDGEYLWLTTTTRRQKTRNWQVQPAVALSITDPGRPSSVRPASRRQAGMLMWSWRSGRSFRLPVRSR